MIVRLLVSNDKANVKKVVLRTDTVIGRSSDCNLRIASKEVSRKHCSILLSDRAVRVRDLGSANGTFLNGSQIEANVDVPAPPGSELEVGNVRFVINYDAPVPAELEASTAEVPNAVLAARLARATRAPDAEPDARQRIVPRPGVPSAPDELSRNGIADSQLDTYRGMRGETLRNGGDAAARAETFNAADPDDEADCTVDERGARRVDDDTFALKESEVADDADVDAISPDFPAVDETISMQAEDVLIDSRSAAPEPPPAGKDAPRSGWKSMFGLFGGTKRPPSEPPADEAVAAPPIAAAATDDARRLEPAPDRGPDPERNRKTVPEFTLPPAGADPEAEGQTLPEFEPVAGAPEPLDETLHLSADESLPPKPPGRKPPELPAGDTNLQDFFRNLSKE